MFFVDACGGEGPADPLLYANLLIALDSGNLNPFGLGYNLAVYQDARVNLAQYLAYANGTPDYAGKLGIAAANFGKTAGLFEQMTRLVSFDPSATAYTPAVLPELARLAREALSLEEAAFAEIGKAIGG